MRIKLLPIPFCEFKYFDELQIYQVLRNQVLKAFEPVQGTVDNPRQGDIKNINLELLQQKSNTGDYSDIFDVENQRFIYWMTVAVHFLKKNILKNGAVLSTCDKCPDFYVDGVLMWQSFINHIKEDHKSEPEGFYFHLDLQQAAMIYEFNFVYENTTDRGCHNLCFYTVDTETKKIIKVADKFGVDCEQRRQFLRRAPRHGLVLPPPYEFHCLEIRISDYPLWSTIYRHDFEDNLFVGYLPLVQRRIVSEQFFPMYDALKDYIIDDLMPDIFEFQSDLYSTCKTLILLDSAEYRLMFCFLPPAVLDDYIKMSKESAI